MYNFFRTSVFVLVFTTISFAAITIGGSVKDKVEVQCDLPVDQRIKNIGSKVDRAGMCVMSSIEMAARWSNLEQMRGLRDWCALQPGGAYPSKVDRQLKEYCQYKNIPIPEFVQDTNADWKDVKEVTDSGRIACVTYSGRDGVRYSGTIAHMVCVVHVDDKRVAILDNNGIGEEELLWMSPSEFDVRFKGNSGGWLFYWKSPGPPSPPFN